MILCARLPYFAASVVRFSGHFAPDVPLAIVNRSKVVATCALASAAGIQVGLTARQAESIVPNLLIAEPNQARQARVTERLLERLAAFTPLVEFETNSPRKPRNKPKRLPDEQQSAAVYLDLERLNHADSLRLAAQIGEAICAEIGITSPMGLAGCKFAAWSAAWVSANKLTLIPTDEEAAYLAPLSIRRLPVDEEIYRRLTLLGLSTLGQVAALPLDAMLTQFGAEGYRLALLARGRDSRPVIPHRFGVVESVTRLFDDPLTRRTALEAILRATAKELSARLGANGYQGRTVILKLYLESGTHHERRITLRQPIADVLGLERALFALLNRIGELSEGVDGFDVRVEGLTPFVGRQLDLFTYAAEQRERLVKTVRTLTTRYEADRFWWVVPANPSARRIEQRYRLHGVHEP